MTPHEQEVFDISRYLRDHAKSDFRHMPEGSIAGVLNRASPEARRALAIQFKAAEHAAETGGRIDEHGNLKPFAERYDESRQRADRPKELNKAIDKLQTEQITNELSQRMGMPTPSNDGPPDRREILSVAFDAHTQE